jgi:hypothetical protein
MRKLTSLALALQLLAVAAALLISAASVDAATLSTQDTVVVLRVGEGAAALSANTASVFLEEYAITFAGGVPTAATHVQTIPIDDPQTAAGPEAVDVPGSGLTIAGTASLEGGLNFSENGQYLMFAGYHSEVGLSTSGKRKIIGRVDLNGNDSYDAIYGSGTTAAGAAIRTVASNTGNEYWFGMTNAAVGISYRTWEGGNNAGVNSTLINAQNPRRLEIDNGQLYVSSAATGIFGVATVGSGTPTSASGVTMLPGMPTATGPSPVDFWFADASTLYIADDRTSASGGLQKWAFESGSWVLKYTKNIDTTNDSFDNGLRGLTGSVGTDGTVTLFGTSTFGTAGGANFLIGISDSLANTDPNNVSVNALASSASIPGAGGAFANFRGLEAIGVRVPEPTSATIMALAAMALFAVRRRGR